LQCSAKYAPKSQTLHKGYNDYVRCVHLENGIETGIITCQDGSTSDYWFLTHHISKDKGGTLFRFSDGSEVYMTGYFCCEVQLPEQPFASLSELRDFIQKRDGTGP
jgi:hypothetical protein